MEKQCCDKRGAVIKAALELVAEQGFHGAPMAMIAERAGVGAGTIYRYFDSKDTLIKAIYATLEERFLERVMEGYPESGSVRERYLHIGETVVRHFMECPLALRFFEQFHNSPFGVEHRREKIFGKNGKDICRELFEEALEQGMVKKLQLPILFSLAFAPLIYICRDHILGFTELDDAVIAQAVQACWDALSAK